MTVTPLRSQDMAHSDKRFSSEKNKKTQVFQAADLVQQIRERGTELKKTAEEALPQAEPRQSALAVHQLKVQPLGKMASDYSSQFTDVIRLLLEMEEARSGLQMQEDRLAQQIKAREAELKKAAEEAALQEESRQAVRAMDQLKIQRLSRTVSEYCGQFAELTRLLVQKEEARAAAQARETALVQREAALEQQLKAREAELKKTVEEAAAQQKARTELQERLATLQDRILLPGQPRTDAEALEGIAALQQSLNSLREITAAQEAHIEALLDSNSWKVTAPMRALSRSVRKVFGH